MTTFPETLTGLQPFVADCRCHESQLQDSVAIAGERYYPVLDSSGIIFTFTT